MLKILRSALRQIGRADDLDMVEHYLTPNEKQADLIVHVVGLTLAVTGGFVLSILSGLYVGIGAVLATSLYALCMVAMLSASTIYNQIKPCAARPVLRKLDEAAIFLMIAGSYTPFTTQRFEGGWALGFTLLVWVLALGGALVKLWAPRLSDKFWSAIYAGFGWLAVLMLKPMIETVHPLALVLLVVGGLIYTAGVLVFISPKVRFRRAIWHGFVVAGAGVHWAAVLIGVVLTPAMVGS
jgi:Predicted membrane protein, hemolysin III homolog